MIQAIPVCLAHAISRFRGALQEMTEILDQLASIPPHPEPIKAAIEILNGYRSLLYTTLLLGWPSTHPDRGKCFQFTNPRHLRYSPAAQSSLENIDEIRFFCRKLRRFEVKRAFFTQNRGFGKSMIALAIQSSFERHLP
jgi:hypothetical protein